MATLSPVTMPVGDAVVWSCASAQKANNCIAVRMARKYKLRVSKLLAAVSLKGMHTMCMSKKAMLSTTLLKLAGGSPCLW